jgi:hypothetical protein
MMVQAMVLRKDIPLVLKMDMRWDVVMVELMKSV